MRRAIKILILLAALILPVTLTALCVWSETIKAELDPKLFGHLDQAKTNCRRSNCGPTAFVNSLVYLQTQFPKLYGETLIPDIDGDHKIDPEEMIAVANDIAKNYMKSCTGCTDGPGTFIEDFILGKRDYIESKSKGNTLYHAVKGGKWRETFEGGTHPGTKKPDFVHDERAPNFADLHALLEEGEDVELFTSLPSGNHYFTLTGITIDPATGKGELKVINPTGGEDQTLTLTGQLRGGFMEFEHGAVKGHILSIVAESADVPSPSTLMILLLGAGGIILFSRRSG